MAPNIMKLCLLVLQLSIVVQGMKYPANLLVKDRFEAPKAEDKGFTLEHHGRRLRRSLEQEASTNKHRVRRVNNPSLCSDPTKIKDHDIRKRLWKFPSDDTHFSFSMTWVGKDFQTILLLATTEFFIFSVQRSALYKSTDFGETFNQTNEAIYEGNIRKNNGLQRSPVDPKMVILVSFSLPVIGVSSLYITLDGTKTWKKVDLHFQVHGALEFHPRKKNWILATASGARGAYLSKDSGMTWKLLRTHVVSVKWGARQDKVDKEEQTILMHIIPHYNGQLNVYNLELWRSRNLGKNFQSIAKHVYSFGVQGPFLFVSVDYKKDEKTRIMQVSKDGGDTFENAQIPEIKPEQFYSIMDMSEGMVFLQVDEKGDTGKGILYTSDADGIVFDKSLENNVYTNDGATDFYKVQSMNGTYLTSRMNSDQSLSTLISFDRGGEWNPIKLDSKLCKDQTATKDANVCSLQIHNDFSRSRGVNVSMGPLSEASAVGIILAHANPGFALIKKSIGIWISRDGGYTWKDTGLRGAHHYAIADHGSLIVAVPAGTGESRSIWYSVDEGDCWFMYEFSTEKFHLTGLVTSPGAQTMRVSLWGYTSNTGTRRWMVYTLNFRDVLEKKCMYDKVPEKSDYEEWIPHGDGKNKGCLLGKKMTFLRPKPKVLCFNGEDYIPQAKVEHCQCSMADLECDYGYYREVGATKCKLDTTKKPKFCQNGEEIDVESKGYRLIPGDECSSPGTNVEKYVDAHKKCHDQYGNYGALTSDKRNAKSSKSSVVAAVVVPITIVALIIAVYFGKKYLDIRKSKPAYQYSSVPQEPEQDMFSSPHHDNDDDDAAMIEV